MDLGLRHKSMCSHQYISKYTQAKAIINPANFCGHLYVLKNVSYKLVWSLLNVLTLTLISTWLLGPVSRCPMGYSAAGKLERLWQVRERTVSLARWGSDFCSWNLPSTNPKKCLRHSKRWRNIPRRWKLTDYWGDWLLTTTVCKLLWWLGGCHITG